MFSDERFLRKPEPPNEPCEMVMGLVPAHSIGATDDDEVNVVNALLADCPHAAAELANFSRLAEALHYSAPPVTAPPTLAARLLAATAAPAESHLGGARAGRPNFKGNSANVYTLNPAKNKKSGQSWSFSYLAAVAASLVLLVLNGAFLVQNRQLQARQRELAHDLAQQNRALILLSAEEPEEVELFDPDGATAAQADVLWNTSLGIAVVYVRAFPESKPDQAYQLWLNQGETKTSGGLFQVDASGMGLLVFSLPQPLDAYDSIGITPEPQTGSPRPTAPPVVRGPI